MGHIIMSGVVPQLTKPSAGILLSDFAEGSIVKINENGSPVDFYVAKHDYESGLNGTGRTLLVRKDCYDARQWNSTNNCYYPDSSINRWLNGDYKSILSSEVQSAIGATKFYLRYNGDFTDVYSYEKSVFLLSMTEFGYDSDPFEGTALSIVSLLQPAYYNGTAVSQWTRTNSGSNGAWKRDVSGAGTTAVTASSYSRPCFTLPSTALFDKTTLLLKGVAA